MERVVDFGNNSSKTFLQNVLQEELQKLENGDAQVVKDGQLVKVENFNEMIKEKQQFILENPKIAACLISQIIATQDDLIIGRNYAHKVIDPLNNELINIDHINTWKLMLEDVPLSELNECWLVNVVAPFLFDTKLKYLMKRRNPKMHPRFIVNVSAMEGVFYRTNKMPMHPHTNMCKAALNMMTRSSGSHYATSHVYMTSVDTGWVTDENPFLE